LFIKKAEFNLSLKNARKMEISVLTHKKNKFHTIKLKKHTIKFKKHTIKLKKHTIKFKKHTIRLRLSFLFVF